MQTGVRPYIDAAKHMCYNQEHHMRALSGSGVKTMNIELVRLTSEYRQQLFDMLVE